MTPARFLGITLLFASLGAKAQVVMPGPQSGGVAGPVQSGPSGQTSALTLMAPDRCPAGLEATHLPFGQMVEAGAAQPRGPGQRLHLTLTSPDSRTIVSATVNVRGWDRVGVAETSGKARALAVRTLTVRFSGIQDHAAAADVWVPGLNSVTFVDLLAISFTDGSGWSPAPGHCRIAPDLFMLVSR